MTEALSSSDGTLLQYTRRVGSHAFRSALADFLAEGGSTPKRPDEETLMVTNGVSHGLALACAHLVPAGRVALLADPTYFLARNIVEQAGLVARALPPPADGQGLAAAFAAACDAVEAETGAQPALLYVVPTFCNPTAECVSADERQKLVEAARGRGVLLVSDDVYQMLSFPGEANVPPPPLRSFDAGGRTVVSLGSFSKYLAPGLRLGWVEAHPDLLTQLTDDGVIVSGGCVNPLASAAVEKALRSGAARQHLDGTRRELAERCAALTEALARHEGELWETHCPPRGGYFLWLRLLGGVEAPRLASQAGAHQVKFCAGPRCAADDASKGRWEQYVRLCFAMHTPDEMREGVARLVAALKAYDPTVEVGAEMGHDR